MGEDLMPVRLIWSVCFVFIGLLLIDCRES
jgi:hypothetical protein